jgi:hypothetical protein
LAIAALTVSVPAEAAVNVLPMIAAPVLPAFITVQVMVWLVAFQGDTVPLRLRGVPVVTVEGTPLIFVTGTKVEGGGDAVLTLMEKSWM